MSDAFLEATNWLYTTFSKYRVSPDFDCDPAFPAPAELMDKLRATPVRQLSGEDLDAYHAHAITTWGVAADYRRFLPRLLELAGRRALGETNSIDAFFLCIKLEQAGWNGWPEHERAAIRSYLFAVFAEALQHLQDHGYEEFDSISAGGWLNEIVPLIEDVQAYLDAWDAASSVWASADLAGFFLGEATALTGAKAPQAKWNAQWEKLSRWLRRPCMKQRFEAGFYAALKLGREDVFAKAAKQWDIVASWEEAGKGQDRLSME